MKKRVSIFFTSYEPPTKKHSTHWANGQEGKAEKAESYSISSLISFSLISLKFSTFIQMLAYGDWIKMKKNSTTRTTQRDMTFWMSNQNQNKIKILLQPFLKHCTFTMHRVQKLFLGHVDKTFNLKKKKTSYLTVFVYYIQIYAGACVSFYNILLFSLVAQEKSFIFYIKKHTFSTIIFSLDGLDPMLINKMKNCRFRHHYTAHPTFICSFDSIFRVMSIWIR